MGARPFQTQRAALALLVACIASGEAARAKTLTFTPSKDNTLFQNASGALSNGAGASLFVGKSAAPNPVTRNHRALVAFALADSIPVGSVVNTVILTMHDNKTKAPGYSNPRTVTLHRVLADWGEGGSHSGVPGGRDTQGGGQGAPAQVGDATWLHTFYATGFWAHPGGDFVPAASASTVVDLIGFYAWGTTSQMVADVQAWVDTPATNFGWMVRGFESDTGTAKRFDSREAVDPALRPKLTVTFTVASPVEPTTWTVVKALYRR